VIGLKGLSRVINSFPGLEVEEASRNAEQWHLMIKASQTADGWRSLEFVAWAVSDLKRGGFAVLLEATSPPPYLNEPGESLRFLLRGQTDDDGLSRIGEFIEEWQADYVSAE
jgi:hypothetical protein